MSDKKIYADWDISLNCECPKCKKYVNLLDYVDFWDCRDDLDIGETKSDVDVVCPECHHEFNVEAQY